MDEHPRCDPGPGRVVRGNTHPSRQPRRGTRIVNAFRELETSADVQERGSYAGGKARLLLAQDDDAEALRIAETAFAMRDEMGITHETVKGSFVIAVEAAFKLGDHAKAEELLAVVEALPPGRYPQFLRAHSLRFRARLSSRGETEQRVEDLFKRAVGHFRELAIPFSLAVAELEYADWLAGRGRAEEAETAARRGARGLRAAGGAAVAGTRRRSRRSSLRHDLDARGRGRRRQLLAREHLAQGADRDLDLIERRLARRQPLQPQPRARAAPSATGCPGACRRSGSARRRYRR